MYITKNPGVVMEKNTLIEKPKIIENLNLSNRTNLKMDGVIEITSSSETLLLIKLKDTSLSINGKDLHISRLDISSGQLEIEGYIECIKYGKSGNIFKRIFK